ncbi:hypothetical protein FHE72_20410 [Rossellomorea vietnamensis]|uniref:Terminase small subunit n=1 Tax=Rossellomorea vietnamensis TaxID=218284 RepID=A0A6I6UJH6_9BACI|nr:hypothetical protein [Rossellomorea vietnamensis]QHE63104.1 hypothetical protein FHE72_20410 [Rossellomorea vietnamensis]
MSRPTKSIKDMSMKMSKGEISAREAAEAQVLSNDTKPVASSLLNNEELKLFNKLKTHNDNFTEADSNSLNMLAQYLYMWARLKKAHSDLSIEDERALGFEKRMIGIDKQINQHMTALCIPLSQRLRLANELAKVMIEEKKLAEIETETKKEVNPLLAVLEATKNQYQH